MKRLFFTALAAVLLSSCSITREFRDPVQADYINPCTDSRNCEECEAWSKNEPKQYARYERRMQGRGINAYCHFPKVDLEAGFYWVRIGTEWTIAEYVKDWNLFCIPGDGNGYYPSEFDEINPKTIAQ